MRVVSLLPSATELLCVIGGGDLLVGRSHECDFPESLASLPILTGQKTHAASSAEIDKQVRQAIAAGVDDSGEIATSGGSLYRLDIELLKSLKPDVILTQDLCDVCSIDLNTVRGVVADMNPKPVIVSLNPISLEDVFDDLLVVGQAVGMEDTARRVMVELRGRFWEARDFVNPYLEGPEVAFLEWMDPLFIGGHWTPQLIDAAGGRHSLNVPGKKSRQITPEDLVASMPDRLIICPCGYDLDAIHAELETLTSRKWWSLLPAVQDGHVALVDGNAMFNRPGPRLVDAYRWLVGWINDRPEVMPKDFPYRPGR